MPMTIEIQTQSPTEVVDITERVAAVVGGAADGSCHLYLRHTTAALMIVTGETGVPEDIMDIADGVRGAEDTRDRGTTPRGALSCRCRRR